MTEPADYSSWLTKQQAADRIGVTTKSIERFVQAGKIQQARWRPSGRGPELAVYEPTDVARIAAERQPGPLPPFLVPAASPSMSHQLSTTSTNGNGHHPESPVNALTISEPGAEWVRALVAGIVQVVSETSQTSGGLLTVREAAARKRVSQACIRRACEAGTIYAIQDRGWKIHPDEVDRFGRRPDQSREAL